jgi:hypothetical protein
VTLPDARLYDSTFDRQARLHRTTDIWIDDRRTDDTWIDNERYIISEIYSPPRLAWFLHHCTIDHQTGLSIKMRKQNWFRGRPTRNLGQSD